MQKNSSMNAEGIFKVIIQRKDGQQTLTSDVFYVPNMRNNLLSLGQLLAKGFSMQMENNYMKLFIQSDKLILKSLLS